MSLLPVIFEHELEALLEALRRDLRTEQQKAKRSTQYREWHMGNVRSALRLLEALNPRGPKRLMYDSNAVAAKVSSPRAYTAESPVHEDCNS